MMCGTVSDESRQLHCRAGSPWPDLAVDVDGAGVVVDDDLGRSLIVVL